MRSRSPGARRLCSFLTCSALIAASSAASADEPLTLRDRWSGHVTFFATGTPLAIDGPDADSTNADTMVQPATVVVPAAKIPPDAMLVKALLYWAGSIPNSNCGATIDPDVLFTPPGGGAPVLVTADACYCSDALASSYDIQVCRADIGPLIAAAGGALAGGYTVDGFAAKIANGATDNASMSVVLVMSAPSLPFREIGLYDGVQTLVSGAVGTAQVSLTGLQVTSPPKGDLTWYVLEGDVGGNGAEQVSVSGSPGGLNLVLSDAVNPPNNPMNHTINTTSPVQTNTIGVDIDAFDISPALKPGDTKADMLYSAGTDKYWLAYNIVGIDVIKPDFNVASAKTAALHTDADNDGVVSPGDTVRYTLHLANTGSAAGVVDILDDAPPEASSFTVVSTGGGMNASCQDRPSWSASPSLPARPPTWSSTPWWPMFRTRR